MLRSTRFATRLLGKPKWLPPFEHEDSDRYSLIRGVPWLGAAQRRRLESVGNTLSHLVESAVRKIRGTAESRRAGMGYSSFLISLRFSLFLPARRDSILFPIRCPSFPGLPGLTHLPAQRDCGFAALAKVRIHAELRTNRGRPVIKSTVVRRERKGSLGEADGIEVNLIIPCPGRPGQVPQKSPRRTTPGSKGESRRFPVVLLWRTNWEQGFYGCRLIAPGSIPRSLLRTFNFEIWKLKCLGACPEDLYFPAPAEMGACLAIRTTIRPSLPFHFGDCTGSMSTV